MMRHWRYLLAAVVFYLLALLATLPAAVVYEQVRKTDPERALQLSHLEGSIWSGQAGSLGVNGHALGALRWDLSPLYLLVGRVHVEWELSSGEGYIGGTMDAGLDGSGELGGIKGLVPVEQVTRLLPVVPLVATGKLSVNIEQLGVEAQRITQAQGVITWHQAGIASPQDLRFGDLQIRLQPRDDGGLDGVVSDTGGPLQVEGRLGGSASGAYNLNLGLAARSGASAELASALKMLGRADNRGLYRLNYSGKL